MNAAKPATGDPELDLVLFITRYGAGGVERMLVQTARALAERDLKVALVRASEAGAYLDALPPAVEQIALEPDGITDSLAALLSRRSPSVAVSAKLGDDRILADARDRAGVGTRVFFRVGNPLGFRLRARGLMPAWRWLKLRRLRALYRRADGFIAVSEGNRDDLHEHLAVARERIHVLPNPVITPELFREADKDPGHPWLEPGQPPVILGVGGLRQQKDFATLIHAFARLRRERDCRLIILGDGRQRRRLVGLASRLGVSTDVDLPGWRGDSYAYMARAAVFALSSIWEGLGNVMIESAALGTPIVATDCPYGPREILRGGRYGELVPVRDPRAFARALARTLDEPPTKEHVRQAAEPYRMEVAARRYAEALALPARCRSSNS